MRSLTLRQQLRLLCLTAASGNVANLQLAAVYVHCPLTAEVFEAAAAAGHIEACNWLRQRGCPWGNALSAAAGAGHQVLCGWLLDCGCPWDEAVLRAAARGGHAGLLELLLLTRSEADSSRDPSLRLLAAAQGCSLPTLQQLHQALLGPSTEHATPPQPQPQAPQQQNQQPQPQRRQRQAPVVVMPEGFSRNLVAAAASSRTPDWAAKVEWLEGQGYPPTVAACCRAAALPDALTRLTWLRRRGYPADNVAVVEAARAGNLEAVRYLLAEGVRPFRDAPCAAARGGHVDILAELHAAGCPTDSTATTVAAFEGHLAAVVWLVETLGEAGAGPGAAAAAPQLGLTLMDSAAYSGDVELLAWLRGRGCPWGQSTFSAAAEAGCEAALEWLAEHGCPMGSQGRPYIHAYDNGDLATLRCLRRLGCPWCQVGSTFSGCLDGAPHLPALRWLLAAGCPVDWGKATEAVARRREQAGMAEVWSWLEEQRRQLRRRRRREVATRVVALAARLACWPRLADVGR